jgi:hypothetical protein
VLKALEPASEYHDASRIAPAFLQQLRSQNTP